MICGTVRCGVTNKKYLRAADTKFCIRDITNVHTVSVSPDLEVEAQSH